jgi:hypothetical protein
MAVGDALGNVVRVHDPQPVGDLPMTYVHWGNPVTLGERRKERQLAAPACVFVSSLSEMLEKRVG